VTRRLAAYGCVLAALATVTFWAPNRFWINVLAQALIFAIFAMSLDFLLGFGGMPSLGHATFFGAGAYAAAIWTQHHSADLLPLLAVGMITGAALALPLGALALRTGGVYFLMLTLAFGQIVWSVAVSDRFKPWFGAEFGLVGIPRPVVLPQLGISLTRPSHFYDFVLLVAVLVFVLLLAVTASPFGRTLQGIRENETRMAALGYPTYRFRLAAFVLAGALAGLAGTLSATYFHYATPGSLFWTNSGLVMIAVILGGAGTLIGPALGAIVVTVLQFGLSAITVPEIADRNLLLLGAAFIAVVLFLPNGIAGAAGLGGHLARVWRTRSRLSRGSAPP
jgi:branched-chain amino acid transport system permease protein